MILKKYELDDTVSKVSKEVRLLQTEKGIVELGENALAVLIMLDEIPKGCVFHGQGRLLIDAIVETREGAVGKPIDRELNEPFLMLGDTEDIQKYLTNADEEEFAKMGYENQQRFIAKAEDLRRRFFNGGMQEREASDAEHGSIFAFPNVDSELDILVARGSKLVYNAKSTIFVSNKDKTVLKSPGEVIVSSNGKSVIIKKGKSVVIEK